MNRLKVPGAQAMRQRLQVAPPTPPKRLREIATARRIDAAQRAAHLAKRGDTEDYHARWVHHEITRLVEEAEDLERDADVAERSTNGHC